MKIRIASLIRSLNETGALKTGENLYNRPKKTLLLVVKMWKKMVQMRKVWRKAKGKQTVMNTQQGQSLQGLTLSTAPVTKR